MAVHPSVARLSGRGRVRPFGGSAFGAALGAAGLAALGGSAFGGGLGCGRMSTLGGSAFGAASGAAGLAAMGRSGRPPRPGGLAALGCGRIAGLQSLGLGLGWATRLRLAGLADMGWPGPGPAWGRIACRCSGGLWSGCGSCRRISWARGAGRTAWSGLGAAGGGGGASRPRCSGGPPSARRAAGAAIGDLASCTARGAATGRIRRPSPRGLDLLPRPLLVQLPDLHRLPRDLAPTPLIQPLEPHGCLRVRRELRDRTGQHELARIVDVRDVVDVVVDVVDRHVGAPSSGCSRC